MRLLLHRIAFDLGREFRFAGSPWVVEYFSRRRPGQPAPLPFLCGLTAHPARLTWFPPNATRANPARDWPLASLASGSTTSRNQAARYIVPPLGKTRGRRWSFVPGVATPSSPHPWFPHSERFFPMLNLVDDCSGLFTGSKLCQRKDHRNPDRQSAHPRPAGPLQRPRSPSRTAPDPAAGMGSGPERKTLRPASSAAVPLVGFCVERAHPHQSGPRWPRAHRHATPAD
jgi:hypothetical protein